MKLFVFALLLLVPLVAAEECIQPDSMQEISTSVTFCSGRYAVPDGFTVTESDLTIRCLDTQLIGSSKGTAFSISNADNVVIEGCSIEQYGTGVALKNSENIKYDENTFTDVRQVRSKLLEETHAKPNLQIEDLALFKTPQQDLKDFVASFGRSYENVIEEQKRLVLTDKSQYFIKDDILHMKIDVEVNVQSLSVYVYVPKEYAEDASQVQFDTKVEVIQADPLFRKKIDLLEGSNSIQFSFKINNVTYINNDNPPTFFLMEENLSKITPEVEPKGRFSWFFIIGAILLVLAAYWIGKRSQ